MVRPKLLEPDRSRPIAVVKIDRALHVITSSITSSLSLCFHPILMGARPSLKVFLSTPPVALLPLDETSLEKAWRQALQTLT